MIETDVLRSTLEHALRHGGDFAEVFVEDRRVVERPLRRRQGRGARVRAASAAPGIRVVRGETTGFAHTADLSEAGLRRAAEAAAAAARGAGGPAPRRRARRAGRSRRPHEVDGAARDGGEGAARSSCSRGPTHAARAESDAITSGERVATPTPAAGSWSPTPTACSPRTTRCAPASWCSCVATGDTGMQTGIRGARAARSASSSSTRSIPRTSARIAADARAHAARRACPRRRGKLPVVLQARRRRRAVPRGVRPRARGRPRRQGRVGVPRARSASRSRRRSSRWSTTARTAASGARYAIDDEGAARAAQRAHRGRRAHRLHVGPPARPQGGPAEQRQRPARDLPAPADGAHDEHVPARRATTTPTTSSADAEYGLYCVAARRRPGRTPPPATSCSASPRRT